MTLAESAPPRLRSIGLGELLDQAVRLYRRNFTRFIGMLALVQVPLALLQLGVSFLTSAGYVERMQDPFAFQSTDPFEALGAGYFAGIGASLLLAIIAFLAIQGVAAAALTRAIADSYLGRPPGILEAYRRVGRSWVDLVLALLLAGIIVLALSLWATFIPCLGWFSGPGILAFLAMGVIPLMAPVIVLERRGATAGLRRAWDLARSRFWWVMGFLLVLTVFSQVVVGGPSALLGVAISFLGGDPVSNLPLRTLAQSLVSVAFGLLYYPLHLTAIALLYFDLRVRSEGFDLSLSAEGAKGEPLDVATVASTAPTSAVRPLLTWPEVGNFALASVLVFVGFGILMLVYMMLGLLPLMASGGI